MADEGSEVKGNKLAIPLLAVLIILLLVLIFTITPLRSILFPEKSAPEINLVLAEFPEWDEELTAYKFLVEARITGNPVPEVHFSRNDDLIEAGQNRSLIHLEAGEKYILEATAINSQGTAEAFIELIADEAEIASLSGDVAADNTADETTDGDVADISSSEESSEENETAFPPRITEVIYKGENITALVGRGDSPPAENISIDYIEEEHEFTILVDWGEDFGRRSASNLVSHGRLGYGGVFDVSEDIFIISWIAPANDEGSIEPLYANISFKIQTKEEDNFSDKITIGIALEPVIASIIPREELFLGIAADNSLSGYVTSEGLVRTGTILVGDNDTNNQIKGYLTFNLSRLAGVTSEQISRASIRFNYVNKSGNPEGFARFVDFKVYNYGTTLDPGDFAIGGSRFQMIGTTSFSTGSTAQGSLITELQRAIDSRSNRLQVKIGLDGDTDSDGAWDIFQFNPAMVFLEVHYYD